MALESWGGLRFGLMALGYQQVIWTHLHCVACGVFKLAIAEELKEYPCPACGACKVAIIAQASRATNFPLPKESVSPCRRERGQPLADFWADQVPSRTTWLLSLKSAQEPLAAFLVAGRT